MFDEELLYLAMSKSEHPVEIVLFDYVSFLLYIGFHPPSLRFCTLQGTKNE